ncbi:hypothetical protein ACIRRA_39585 [Nocardia sp. NPDC101769]|uniref:hypothetical protein n=1 Tax=Nocardia sp. NPDC101769 TaxID=3364333 RepID=UPI0038073CA7
MFDRLRREHGRLVDVDLAEGIPATLVLGYQAALAILNDLEHFPADPRAWQSTVSSRCPVLPLMEWGPPATESEHRFRYRPAYRAALDAIDQILFVDPGVPVVTAQKTVSLLLDRSRSASGRGVLAAAFAVTSAQDQPVPQEAEPDEDDPAPRVPGTVVPQ